MKTVKEIVNEAYLKVTLSGKFDIKEGNKPIINAKEKKLKMVEVPDYMASLIDKDNIGCCFVFSSELIKLMHDNGLESFMVFTLEGTGIRASVLYADDNKDYVIANPVEDIEYFTNNKIKKEDRLKLYDGTKLNGEDKARIPVQEFANKFGKIWVFSDFYDDKKDLCEALSDISNLEVLIEPKLDKRNEEKNIS